MALETKKLLMTKWHTISILPASLSLESLKFPVVGALLEK
jgi:hypothetical protein